MKELELRWNSTATPIQMYRKLRMPQFEIKHITPAICQESFHIGEIKFQAQILNFTNNINLSRKKLN